MSKNSYPKVPWRTVKDPIAGHPRTYENGIKLDWYTTEAPAGSYRSIFKWGNPKEYKVPSEGMFNYMMKKLMNISQKMKVKYLLMLKLNTWTC